jgi:hypothetical protein
MTGMGGSESLLGVFAQKQIPPSTASRLPIPAVALCAPAFIGARGSASQARLFTPFFKGGERAGSRLSSALFTTAREPLGATDHERRGMLRLLAPFEKGGGHCNAMAGDLRL